MPKRIAIDWDDTELRLVAAQCSGSSVRVTDAAVIPIAEAGVVETLRAAMDRRGLEKLEVMVAIGRGKAELRELKLPPVPDNELPDMVRFQAIRSFASAGESAAVDYLVTHRSDDAIALIAAAVGPSKLDAIKQTCEKVGSPLKRIALRPLTAAALYLSRHAGETGESVLIDLLADDAEIVIARDGDVIYIRTVRLPSDEHARPQALAGEIRRSLVACGSTDPSRRLLLWGRAAVHREDVELISRAIGGEVSTLDPFSLVDVEQSASQDLPEHVGRLAPLVGLLACDECDPGRLIDFLNPRRRVEAKSNRPAIIGLAAVAAVLVCLAGWFGYQRLAGLDKRIEVLQAQNNSLQPLVDSANLSVQRTEKVDQFLDGNVNWLSEFQRIATKIPPADELIINNITARSGSQAAGIAGLASGESTITIDGFVTEAGIIAEMEDALRDESHRVTVEGSEEQETDDAYAWSFGETITIDAEQVRVARYQGINEVLEPTANDATAPQPPASQAEDDSRADSSDVSESDSVNSEGSDGLAAPDEQPESPESPKSEDNEEAKPNADGQLEASGNQSNSELAARRQRGVEQ